MDDWDTLGPNSQILNSAWPKPDVCRSSLHSATQTLRPAHKAETAMSKMISAERPQFEFLISLTQLRWIESTITSFVFSKSWFAKNRICLVVGAAAVFTDFQVLINHSFLSYFVFYSTKSRNTNQKWEIWTFRWRHLTRRASSCKLSTPWTVSIKAAWLSASRVLIPSHNVIELFNDIIWQLSLLFFVQLRMALLLQLTRRSAPCSLTLTISKKSKRFPLPLVSYCLLCHSQTSSN